MNTYIKYNYRNFYEGVECNDILVNSATLAEYGMGSSLLECMNIYLTSKLYSISVGDNELSICCLWYICLGTSYSIIYPPWIGTWLCIILLVCWIYQQTHTIQWIICRMGSSVITWLDMNTNWSQSTHIVYPPIHMPTSIVYSIWVHWIDVLMTT